MKIFIAGLLFLVSLVMSVPVSFAQQDPSYQKLAQEMEILKEEVLTLQNQLQTVENVEKMKLSAELADAKAKLINAEFGRLERELRDFNHGWLMAWNLFFLTALAVFFGLLALVGRNLWSQFKSNADQLIADEVGKRVNSFEESVSDVGVLKDRVEKSIGDVNILADKIRVLDKEHAADVIERSMHYPLSVADSYPEEIRTLSEEALLDVFCDETRDMETKIKTLEILTDRGSIQLVSPTLELLNSTLDSYEDEELGFYIANRLGVLIEWLGYTSTEDTYEGLTKILDRLVLRRKDKEDREDRDFLLTAIAFSFARVGHKLNKGDWISLLKARFSDLDVEPETIKGILSYLPNEMPSVDDFKDYLLELLEPHDAEFVNEERERRANANTETEGNS